MEKKDGKKKISISPEQIEKAAEAMGKGAGAIDTFWSNLKDDLGPWGKALGFAVLGTLVLAMIHSPGLVIVLLLLVALGGAPMVYKKGMEFKAVADARKQKAEAAAAAAAEAPKAEAEAKK